MVTIITNTLVLYRKNYLIDAKKFEEKSIEDLKRSQLVGILYFEEF